MDKMKFSLLAVPCPTTTLFSFAAVDAKKKSHLVSSNPWSHLHGLC